MILRLLTSFCCKFFQLSQRHFHGICRHLVRLPLLCSIFSHDYCGRRVEPVCLFAAAGGYTICFAHNLPPQRFCYDSVRRPLDLDLAILLDPTRSIYPGRRSGTDYLPGCQCSCSFFEMSGLFNYVHNIGVHVVLKYDTAVRALRRPTLLCVFRFGMVGPSTGSPEKYPLELHTHY